MARKPLTIAPLTPAEDAALRRGAKRAAAIEAGALSGYRMVSRTQPARKGKGSYRRKGKYGHQAD